MRTEKEIKADAYERAENEACNTDCARYRIGTCVGNKLNKTNCYRFKASYDYYVGALIEHECTADHHIMTCDECDEYHECRFVYH